MDDNKPLSGSRQYFLEMAERVRAQNRERVRQAGIRVDGRGDELIDLILSPSEGPENFFRDGAVNIYEATKQWVSMLTDAGLSTDEMLAAIKLNFD